MKLSDYVISFFADKGIREVFYLSGGGAMHLVDSLGREARLRKIATLHEQAAAIAADSATQCLGTPGLCVVTTGPGGTNAVTGVAASWIDSNPVIFVSGQAKSTELIGDRGVRQMGIQEVDITAVVKPITKYAVTLRDPEKCRYEVERCWHAATTGRKGPVWLDIPLDVQGATIDPQAQAGFVPEETVSSTQELDALLEPVLQELRHAQRPVILAGNGIRNAGAVQEFREFVRRLQVPVLLTHRTIDFLDNDDPLNFGRPGIIASRYANFIQQNADVLLVIGSRLDLTQVGFNYPGFASKAKTTVIDIDPAVLKKFSDEKLPMQRAICADAGAALAVLLAQSSGWSQGYGAWLERCRDWKGRYPLPTRNTATGSASARVNPFHLIDAISGLAKPEDVIVCGSSGGAAEISLMAYANKDGQRVYSDPGLGSMGFAVPASLGAAVATCRRVIAFDGDGSLQHNIQDLITISRHQLPVLLFIFNNGCYNSIQQMQKNRFAGHYVGCHPASGVNFPQMRKVADCYEWEYRSIANLEELDRLLPEIMLLRGPVLVDVAIDADVATEPKVSSKVNPDGSIVSMPMENLAPFLPEEEFRAQMR